MKPKRGRPLLPSNKAKREAEKLLADSRPHYAINRTPSNPLSHLADGTAFKSVKKGLGLNHTAIPDALVLDVLSSMEGGGDDFLREVNTRINEKTEAIKRNAKRGGDRHPTSTVRHKVEANDTIREPLRAFYAGEMRCKTLIRLLEKEQLPVPSERTLRRWKSENRTRTLRQ